MSHAEQNILAAIRHMSPVIWGKAALMQRYNGPGHPEKGDAMTWEAIQQAIKQVCPEVLCRGRNVAFPAKHLSDLDAVLLRRFNS